jgi:hypothetical protein
LLSSAVISPIVIVHNQKQNNHNLKADSNNSLPTEDSVNELLNDALTKISKKIY